MIRMGNKGVNKGREVGAGNDGSGRFERLS